MLYSIITTIQKPTASVLGLVDKLNEVGGKLIVAGDKKGPASYEAPSGELRVTGGESGEESRVEGPESRAAASGGWLANECLDFVENLYMKKL